MIGIVSRLTNQKGLDLIQCVMDEICTDDVQLVVLGTGDENYENMFRHYDWKYHDRVSAQIYYSEPLSHKIYAACDAFLMPSLFEPCGLDASCMAPPLRNGADRPRDRRLKGYGMAVQ